MSAKIYTVTTPEGAELYLSNARTIIGINIPDGIETITFSGEASEGRGSIISAYYTVQLRELTCQFPDVKEVIIGRDVIDIHIANEMFPNVRKVTSHSSKFQSGSMLIYNGYSYASLYNTFCRKSDEVVDLNGIKGIQERAFSGCLSTKIINADKIISVARDAFEGSMFPYLPHKNGVVMAGPILVDVDADVDEITIGKNVNVLNPGVGFKNVKKLHIQNPKDMEKMWGIEELGITDIYIDSQAKLDALFCDQFQNHGLGKLERVHIDENNPWCKSVDGIVYSKNGDTLFFCPEGRTGDLKIPEGTKFIYSFAFESSNLSSVALPDSMQEIGSNAFYCCQELKFIDFGNGIERIGTNDGLSVITMCINLKQIEIPSQVKYICRSAFAQGKLEKVILNEGIEYIDEYAFHNNKIGSITLPSTLKSVGKQSLVGTKEIVIKGDEIPVNLIPAVVTNSKNISANKLEELYSRVITIKREGKEDMSIPFCLSAETMEKLNFECMMHGFKDVNLTRKIYEYASTSDAKQDIAIYVYNKTKDDSIGAYLRRVSGIISKRLLKKGEQECLVEFLETGLVTENAMKKLLKDAEAQNATLVTAYILKSLDKINTKTSFKL